MSAPGIGKDLSAFYNRILLNLDWKPKYYEFKMADKTRAGHNTRSMIPKYDRPLKIVKDISELQLNENHDNS